MLRLQAVEELFSANSAAKKRMHSMDSMGTQQMNNRAVHSMDGMDTDDSRLTKVVQDFCEVLDKKELPRMNTEPMQRLGANTQEMAAHSRCWTRGSALTFTYNNRPGSDRGLDRGWPEASRGAQKQRQ